MTAAAPAQLVNIQDLQVTFPQLEGSVLAVRGVSIHLDEGESLGLVGESGSGKSVSCMALLRLLNSPPAKVEAKRLEIAGVEVTRVSRAELSRLRGGVAAMIFQDPMTAFDPSYTIGYQIIETIRSHRGTPKKAARAEALRLLERVQIQNAEAILDSHPHQLSGGMLQRAMIAMALSCQPRLLIADRQLLWMWVQAQILQLIKALQEELGMALIMITHDLGVVAETVDRVVVMYGGKVMETAPVEDLFEAPAHPYTEALLGSIPGQNAGRGRLTEIPGSSPDPALPPSGCPFHPRCQVAEARCSAEPPFVTLSPQRSAACWSSPNAEDRLILSGGYGSVKPNSEAELES